MALVLATVAECKAIARITSTATQDDALIVLRAAIVARRIQKWLGVELENDGAFKTEYHWGVPLMNGRIKLKRRPIYSSAGVPQLTVYEDISGQFTGAAVSTDEYLLNTDRAILDLRWRSFLRGKGSLKIVYKGGYTYNSTTGLLEVPDDIKYGFLEQFAFDWQRKNGPAVKGINAGGTNMSFMDDEIQPAVQELLWPYARRDI
jgi:hypothetical protein